MNETQAVPRTVDDYLELPYTIEVIRDSTDGGYTGYFARVIELPGCMTQADNFDELDELIRDAMRGWIMIQLEEGNPIPLPRANDDYSGRFVVRLPKSLHQRLANEAEREGVSLNTLVNVALAEHVGMRQAQA